MKKYFLYMLSIAVVTCLLLTGQQSNAQVYKQFEGVGTYRNALPYDELVEGKTEISEDDFVLPPNNQKDIELNDGYYELPLGFTYRFNGVDYTSVWISINGFITFNQPPSLVEVARDPKGLFRIDNSTPNNVIAPFWGDHKYRSSKEVSNAVPKNKYAKTSINYKPGTYEIEDPKNPGVMITRKMMLIEWENLNVCYADTINDIPVEYPGNVSSFLLIMYQGVNDADARQGNIEFKYDFYGPIPSQPVPSEKSNVLYASVGFKGEGFGLGDRADFINALHNGRYGGSNPLPAIAKDQQTSTKLCELMPPSGSNDYSIIAYSFYSVNDAKVWGDGDADMSKAEGGRHYTKREQQNFYVTINDVRTIMRSVVTGDKLDSAYAEAAYHADVHHDGRYYYLVHRNVNNVINVVTEGYQRSDINGYVFDEDGNPVYCTDTFYIKKALPHEGGFGFLPYYGQNDNIMHVEIPSEGVSGTVTIISPDKPIDDYTLLVAKVRDSDIYFSRVDSVLNRKDMKISLKKRVNWRSQNIAEDLPPIITNYRKQLLWEADEKDASIILSYLGAKVPFLPWIHDDVIFNKNKIGNDIFATNINFNNIIKTKDNTYKVPVYVNGIVRGAVSSKFTLKDVDIINVESANADIFVDFSNNTKNIVLVGEGTFNESDPVAYLTINTENSELIANDVKFDGNNVANVYKKLNTNVELEGFDVLAQNIPNPVTNFTTFTVNLDEDGDYTLVITDILGNLVRTITNGNIKAGTSTFNWDCTNENGITVPNGTYFYRLIGNGSILTKRLVLSK